MTDTQILEAAIYKAIDGGWSFEIGDNEFVVWLDETHSPSVTQHGDMLDHQRIIFDHDFAKALWPGYINTATWEICQHSEHGDMPLMYWHLQQMVIADDPIQYLGENM